MSRTRGSTLLFFYLTFACAAAASAAGNDLILTNLGTCEFVEIDGRDQCVSVTPRTEDFLLLSRDLGLTLSPKGMSGAETLGEAGFGYAFELGFNMVDASQDYWQDVVQDGDPSDLLMVSQFHITKGLPFSFEIGAVLSHLFSSSMWALGAELTWALHEDFLWPVPDLGVRGFVNNVVGSQDLNLTTTGFDIVVGIPVGVSNVFTVAPYAGYNLTVVFSSSRLLDGSPDDPSPPIEGGEGQQSIKPEFVFDNTDQTFHRVLAGLRFKYAFLNSTFEFNFGDVTSINMSIGFDF